MKFKPAIPHNAVSRKTGMIYLQLYSRRITFCGTGHTYMSFRYFAACRFCDRLRTA